jgi:hypothetical protein
MKNVHLGRPTLSNRLTGRKKRGGNLTHDGANPVSGSDSHLYRRVNWSGSPIWNIRLFNTAQRHPRRISHRKLLSTWSKKTQ